MRFFKYQATGNDYLVLDTGGETVDGALVRRVCDRRLGVGADGVLLEVPAGDGFGLRIVNPDGSASGISGNGLRIFARWLHDAGRVGSEPFTVELPRRRVRCEVLDGGASVRVAMGRATFASAEVPVAGPAREVVDEPLDLGDETVRIVAVGLGNPHAVVPVEHASQALAERLGPRIERHPAFPERTNVQVAEVVDRGRVRAHVWERGVGTTLASGSSACAVAAALHRLGRVDGQVAVVMPGGTLRVDVAEDGEATLHGAVAAVAVGTLAHEWLDAVVRGPFGAADAL